MKFQTKLAERVWSVERGARLPLDGASVVSDVVVVCVGNQLAAY